MVKYFSFELDQRVLLLCHWAFHRANSSQPLKACWPAGPDHSSNDGCIPLCLVEAWVNLKWRNLERHMLMPMATRPQKVWEAMVLFPERCVFLLSLPGSVFFSARQQGYGKKQREPLPLRVTGKGETLNDKKRNGAERSRGRKCLGKG